MAKIVVHLEFLPIPYSEKSKAQPWSAARSLLAKKQSRGTPKGMNARKLGKILERKYNILEVFREMHEEEIVKPIIKKYSDIAIRTLTRNYKPINEREIQNMQPVGKKIEKLFQKFLNNEEMNGLPGIPTDASTIKPGRRRTRRPGPSFIDTGIYRAAFTAWVDTK